MVVPKQNFRKHSKTGRAGDRYIVYPGNSKGSIGTIALTALAYIDYLRTKNNEPNSVETLQPLYKELDEYLTFIAHARRSDKR